jgi:hypothetical protein
MNTGSRKIVCNQIPPAAKAYEDVRDEVGSGEQEEDPVLPRGEPDAASRYQQLWSDSNVGQGKKPRSVLRTRAAKPSNKGPVEL